MPEQFDPETHAWIETEMSEEEDRTLRLSEYRAQIAHLERLTAAGRRRQLTVEAMDADVQEARTVVLNSVVMGGPTHLPADVALERYERALLAQFERELVRAPQSRSEAANRENSVITEQAMHTESTESVERAVC